MMTRLTAYIIATCTDLVFDAGRPDDSEKWVGWILLGEEDRYRPLANSEAIYDSAEEAKQAMHDIVKKVRLLVAEETKGEHPIDHVLDQVHKSA